MKKIKARDLIVGKCYMSIFHSPFVVVDISESSISSTRMRMKYKDGNDIYKNPTNEILIEKECEFLKNYFKFGY